MPSLEVLDHGDPVSISFEDLLKYHGRSSIAGVAHGFKVMERAFPLLSPEGPPERHDIAVDTAFPGPGTRDAVEMVTRAVTGGRFRVAEDVGPADAPEAPEGRFSFRLAYRGATVALVLRPGLVPAEFVALVRRGPATPAEEALLARLKEEMTARLLALPADQVYDVV